MNRLARMRDALKGSREKQIGLAVLGSLTFVLLVVIVWKVRRPAADALPDTTDVVKKGEPKLFGSDSSKPTVVQPGIEESYVGRRAASAAREIAPPSEPINSVDPTSRHIDDLENSASPHEPRVAQRSKPSDLQPNPLRSRATEDRPAGDSASREAAEVGVSDLDVPPPRRPLRRAIEADDDEPSSRRSVYERPSDEKLKSDVAAKTDARDEVAEINPLRKQADVEPPPARKITPREVVADDPIPPVRSAAAPARAKVETREAPVETSEEPPRRSTVKEVAPVVGRISNPSHTGPASRPAAPSARTYVVHEGDTIYDIAQFELGRSSRWVEIVALNRATLGDDIHFLRAGMKLVLPPDGAAARVAQQPSDEHR